MRRIYGACQVNDGINLLIVRNLSKSAFLQYVDKKQAIPQEHLIGAKLLEHLESIPECFQVDFSQYPDIMFDAVVRNEKYLKELNPTQLLNPTALAIDGLVRDVGDWLHYQDRPLCILPQVSWRLDNDGYQIQDGVLTHKTYKEISVLRTKRSRYVNDMELDELCVSLDNGYSTYHRRAYINDSMVDTMHVFDYSNRLWRKRACTVDDDIVAIRRKK